ncbi:MAG: iron-sulfur cluster repair di-iron protein [Bacteroidales bacterium]|nr:iron-sulfur cluster repair di-iron protein [Bacteroidales bacterium]
MTNVDLKEATIGQIVADDFRAAELFKRVGIDFCCGGNKSVAKACAEKNLDADQLMAELSELSIIKSGQVHDFKSWKIDFLADYIVNTHHQYVLKNLPELEFYTQKIARVHGDTHPELEKVAELFSKIKIELSQHLEKEEKVLFPAIKAALNGQSEDAKSTIVSEIARMSIEHEFAGGAMDEINRLTNGYQIPLDACNTYRVALQLLAEFEDDLHVHVHLENNILYPKALSLTK